jgi:hypothetical protein
MDEMEEVRRTDLKYLHVIGAAEDGRLDVEATVNHIVCRAAGEDLGTFSDADVDVVCDAVVLSGGNLRTKTHTHISFIVVPTDILWLQRMFCGSNGFLWTVDNWARVGPKGRGMVKGCGKGYVPGSEPNGNVRVCVACRWGKCKPGAWLVGGAQMANRGSVLIIARACET